jgi:hypothetical protein
MIRALFWAGLGFSAYYLYNNPNDFIGLSNALIGTIHSLASFIADLTASGIGEVDKLIKQSAMSAPA